MRKENRIYLLILIPIFLIVVVAFVPAGTKKDEIIQDATVTVGESNKITVYVTGEVKNKGTYVMYNGKTIYDLLKKCGLTDYSDASSINLDEELKNGYTYSISVSDNSQKEVTIKVTQGTISNVPLPKAKTNINTATKEELIGLEKIGEERAAAIIAYREKTPFKKIEDIMNVSGISEAIFNEIKDYITV